MKKDGSCLLLHFCFSKEKTVIYEEVCVFFFFLKAISESVSFFSFLGNSC
ncbi:hypothetical protein CSUI_006086 [Cystoisospora suis]|uniref:Uncharacterized protein n=1 Tax=Cystoisospora suis TaxID=483139 RepID=A0A2C6KRJ1_9APIC|nr:hypothetical protein CSUI_006086 [Cystoisospora suis]